MSFIDELRAIAGDDELHIWPDDEFGVPDAATIIGLAPSGAALYICGPIPMLDAIRAAMPDPQIDTCTTSGSARRPSSAALPSR